MLNKTSDSNLAAYAEHDNAPSALVIGSGFGGLASAVRLAARGYRVTVHEKTVALIPTSSNAP